jgi:hypothetical protein
METESEHLREIRAWLTLAEGSIEHKQVLDQSSMPHLVKEAKYIADTIEELGLERLSLLMNDRSIATTILENCNTLNKKIEDADWEICNLIAEAFSKIFENVPDSRFNFSGLSEGQRTILKGNVQILKENFVSSVVPWTIFFFFLRSLVFDELLPLSPVSDPPVSVVVVSVKTKVPLLEYPE